MVLAGGCFDILHIGHIRFLKQAKALGTLFVLLESDAKVNKLKGDKRPFYPQTERAEVLSALSCVDFVVILPTIHRDDEYVKVVTGLHPNTIALTERDPYLSQKMAQAKLLGGKIKVIPHLKTFSTSSLAELLGVD